MFETLEARAEGEIPKTASEGCSLRGTFLGHGARVRTRARFFFPKSKTLIASADQLNRKVLQAGPCASRMRSFTVYSALLKQCVFLSKSTK